MKHFYLEKILNRLTATIFRVCMIYTAHYVKSQYFRY